MHKETVLKEAALNSQRQRAENRALYCALVNILRIFAFSLVLGHSNSKETICYFNRFGVLGTPCMLMDGYI